LNRNPAASREISPNAAIVSIHGVSFTTLFSRSFHINAGGRGIVVCLPNSGISPVSKQSAVCTIPVLLRCCHPSPDEDLHSP
jgi:hypothetical protein